MAANPIRHDGPLLLFGPRIDVGRIELLTHRLNHLDADVLTALDSFIVAAKRRAGGGSGGGNKAEAQQEEDFVHRFQIKAAYWRFVQEGVSLGR